MFGSRTLLALVVVVSGGVAAFAIYTFGWREADHDHQAKTAREHVFTARSGDVVRVSATRTECQVSAEAGIPNLFCMAMGRGGRYQVVFWNDRVDVYDLARHGEPMVPTFAVPARLPKSAGRGLRYCELPGDPGNFLAASRNVSCAVAKRVRDKAMSRPCLFRNRCVADGFACLAYWDGRYDRPFYFTSHGICTAPDRRRIVFDNG